MAQVIARLTESSARTQIDEAAEKIVDACCDITAPDFPRIYITDSVHMNAGGGGAISRKPGNLVLDLRRLLVSLAAAPLAIIGVADHPWTALFAALTLWDVVLSKLEVSIEEREAGVLWALWLNRNENTDHIEKSDVLTLVNSERQLYGRQPLSQLEMDDAIVKLTKLRCLKEDESTYFLCEPVRVEFV